MGACIVEPGWWATAFVSVSMSSVRGVVVSAGIDVGVGHVDDVGVGQGVDAKVGREGVVWPEVVWGRDLLYHCCGNCRWKV